MIVDDILRGYSFRLLLVLFIMVSMFSLLGWRLWALQLKGGEARRRAISNQSIRQIRIPPIRGRIFSSDGELFADNRPAYDVYFHIHEIRKRTRAKTVAFVQEKINEAAHILGRPSLLSENWVGRNSYAQRDLLIALVRRKSRSMSRKNYRSKEAALLIESGSAFELSEWLAREKILRHIIRYPALPLKAFDRLSEDELARLQELMPGIPGMEIGVNYKRMYLQYASGSHMIGFISKRPAEQITNEERYRTYYYYPEKYGRAGLERAFDKELSGKVGFKMVRVDSVGRYYEELKRIDAVAGNDLILTIDARAQRLAQQLLEGRRGAIACVNVHTGAILALASSPTYDLNSIRRDYGKLARDPDKPLLNRALSAGWTPGSIVKPIVAMAVLENDIAAYDTLYNCVGYYVVGKNTRIHCHNRSGHGELNLLKAMEVSCNPYFIHMGLKLGIDRLSQYYAIAGLGRETGVELKSKWYRGWSPSPEEKRRRYGPRARWYASDTAYVSIGQGFIALSPLHVAVYIAAIANGGIVYRPFLVRAIRAPNGRTLSYTRRQITGRFPVRPETLRIVRAAMYNVVHGRNATAPVCRSDLVKIAGKTGTAEMGGRANRWDNTWFACFAPFDNPQYALVVLVEHGKSGGKTAAPIARAFFDEYIMMQRRAEHTIHVP